MFLIDWMFDKMGYTKKVDWTTVFGKYEVTLDVPDRGSKVTVKKPSKKVATKRKTVAKKSVKIQSAPTKGNFSKKQIQGAIKAARKKA
jgi:hypothetical protein